MVGDFSRLNVMSVADSTNNCQLVKRELPSWPSFSKTEAEAAAQILLSNKVNYWTGSEGRNFENEFASFFGTAHAVAVSNGTVAIEAALEALQIGIGDEVIVTPRTFMASVSAIVRVGGTPVFADVNRNTQNIDASSIAKVITGKTKAIICVHLAGWPCEMDEINELADYHSISIIEDCAQAHGAKYKDKSVGSLGDVGCWSFCQDKIISTCGEGGMITTDCKSLWENIWSLKDHGKSWDSVNKIEYAPGYRWVHDSIGTNFRLTEIQSAVGRIQLGLLPKWSDLRLEYAQMIWLATSKIPGIRTPTVPEHIRHAAYRCYIFLEVSSLKSNWSRNRIVNELENIGVQIMHGTCSEVYREKAFVKVGCRPSKPLPVAEELGQTSLMFKIHPTLSREDVLWSIEQLKRVMAQAVK